MGEKFAVWFLYEYLPDIFEAVKKGMWRAFCWFVGVLTSPVWIIPFVYWYFTERRREEADEDE